MSALLQITIETEDTTDKLKAPTVPSWNLWLSLIFKAHRSIQAQNFLDLQNINTAPRSQ